MKQTLLFVVILLCSLSNVSAQTAPPIAEPVSGFDAHESFVRSAIRDSLREESMRSWSNGSEHPCNAFDEGGFPHMVPCGRPLVIAGRGRYAGQTCISESADNSEFACWPKSCGCYVDTVQYGYGTLCRRNAEACWETPVVYARELRAPSATRKKYERSKTTNLKD